MADAPSAAPSSRRVLPSAGSVRRGRRAAGGSLDRGRWLAPGDGEPAPAGRAHRQAPEAAGPSVEWRWRARMGSAWASLLMGARVRARILFGQVGAAVAELGYAEWESLSLSGEAFCVYGSAPAEALAQFLRARALASAVRSGAALASAQLGVGLCRLAVADEGGLDDVRAAGQLFDQAGHRLGLVRALLCCGQAGEAERLPAITSRRCGHRTESLCPPGFGRGRGWPTRWPSPLTRCASRRWTSAWASAVGFSSPPTPRPPRNCWLGCANMAPKA